MSEGGPRREAEQDILDVVVHSSLRESMVVVGCGIGGVPGKRP
jgi:hypothetical protein